MLVHDTSSSFLGYCVVKKIQHWNNLSSVFYILLEKSGGNFVGEKLVLCAFMDFVYVWNRIKKGLQVN